MTTYGSKMIKAVIRHIVKAVNKASQSRWFPMAFVIYSINCKARFHKPDCRTYFQSQHLYQIKFFFLGFIYFGFQIKLMNKQILTVQGDAALQCITVHHENQSFRFLICWKPSACEKLQSTWIHYILLQYYLPTTNN